jgi:hypothetical protein
MLWPKKGSRKVKVGQHRAGDTLNQGPQVLHRRFVHQALAAG